MIYLFYGEDKYRLKKRLEELKRSADIGLDNMNFREISGDFNAATIISEAMAMPFLSTKRLLVINGLLAIKDKELLGAVAASLGKIPQETEVIFIENDSPDQRLTITKTLMKTAKVESFGSLSPLDTIRTIEQMISDRGGTIDKQVATLLQMYIGNDLVRAENEINKLVAYSKAVTKESVELLVDAGYFNTIFDLTDAISVRNGKKALENLEKLLDSGENEIYLASMIAMQVRNLMLIQDLKVHSLTEQEIISKSKLHPYVVKKSLGQIRNFTPQQLLGMHHALLELDIALKSGTAEPKVLLTKYILDSIN